MAHHMNDEDRQVIVWGQDETVAAIEDLQRKVASGEVQSGALRLFKKDGTYEDIAFGTTDEERAEALAALKRMYSQAH